MFEREAWPKDPVLVKGIVRAIACHLDASTWDDRQLLLMDFCCAAWPTPSAQDH